MVLSLANPNPKVITDSVWRLWTHADFLPGVRLGGIYANKSGYHNTVTANRNRWPGNYSIRLSLDNRAPLDKARAIDYTLSDVEMRKRTKLLRDSALDKNDDRLKAVREFYGTLDSRFVFGLIQDDEDGPWKNSNADITHLWHIHISIFTKYVDDWESLNGILSVLSGETYEQWKGEDDMFCKYGDSSTKVRALQFLLNELGASPRLVEDGIYGDMTANALRTIRGKGDGKVYGPKTYVELHTKLITNNAQPQATTDVIIRQIVEAWLEAHKEELKGEPGSVVIPSKVTITGQVVSIE